MQYLKIMDLNIEKYLKIIIVQFGFFLLFCITNMI